LIYNCDCCGKEFELSKTQIRYIKLKHYCSKLCQNSSRSIDITGRKFGRLTVVSKGQNKDKSNHCMWVCTCGCGNLKEVTAGGLIGGNVKSCGCLIEFNESRIVHGLTKKGYKRPRLYNIWGGIRDRCNCSTSGHYGDYGGRGIFVCEEWSIFQNFSDWAKVNGYTDYLTLERKNNNLGYSPDNCKWATQKEQCNNTRRSRKLTYNGKTQTITQWAEELNIRVSTIQGRINRGASNEQIFFPGSLQKRTGKKVYKDYRDRLMRIWSGIKSRCLCPTSSGFMNYGGRGIKICDEWLVFSVFRDWALNSGYDKSLTIDRKDNTGDYTPENCRWATKKEQQNNTRITRLLEYNGITLCLSDWAKELNISNGAFYKRLKTKKTKDEIFHKGYLPVGKLLEYNGKVVSMSEWASLLNIPLTRLHYKLKVKSLEDIICEFGGVR